MSESNPDMQTKLASTPVDATTGNTNNSGDVVVGVRLSTKKASSGALNGAVAAVDAGSTTGPVNTGTTARYIPLLIDVGNPVLINSAGSPDAIPNYVAIIVPNQSVERLGSGEITVTRAILQQWEGAPDTGDPSHVHILKKIVAAFLNNTVEIGDNIELGGNAGSDAYFQMTGGGEPAVAPAGYARLKFNPTAVAIQASVDNTAWRANSGILFIKQYDPASQDYPVGETTVFESFPNDGSLRGFSCFIPHTFRLPARVAVTGGFLVPGVRIAVSSGSSVLIRSNNTDGDVDFGRDGIFIALGDQWITSIKFVVTNTSLLTATAQNVGNFIHESSLL